MRVSPFAQMPNPDYYVINGATVTVEYGFVAGSDQLMFDYEGSFPINATYSSSNGVLYMTGVAPISEYAIAIQSVVFTTTSQDGNNRQITFAFGNNVTYASSTEHFYRYVYLPPAVSWETAKLRCSDLYMGMQGYLATITSEREMTEVCGRSLYPAWLGGKFNLKGDNAWHWTEGPEGQEMSGRGRSFWMGESLYDGGAQSNWLSYDQWYRFQPTGNDTYLSTTAPPLNSNIAYFSGASNTGGIASFICEYGGLDSPAVASTMSSFTGSTTLLFDCTLFSASDCRTYASQGCTVNSKNLCVPTDCGAYFLESTCLSNWKCGWYVNGEFGVCANTECAALSGASSCQAAPACTFIPTGSKCILAKCSDKGSACSCATLVGCSWRSGVCRNDQALGCNGMDVLYLIDGTSTMMQPFGRYPMGFFGLTEAFADADLSLTGQGSAVPPSSTDYGQRVGLAVFGGFPLVSPPGTGSGGSVTGNPSELAADVQFLQGSYNGSNTQRRIAPSLNFALSAFSKSNRQNKVLVIISSGGIDDLDIAGPIMSKLAFASVIGVALKPTEPATVDSSNAFGSLQTLTRNVLNVTMTNFFTQVLYGLCNGGSQAATAGQFVQGLGVGAGACGFLNATGCVRNPLCAWDPAGLTCGNSGCLDYCSSTQCTSDISCTYNAKSSLCIQQCASQTVVTCNGLVINGTKVCSWVGTQQAGYCADAPCISNANEDACIADTTAVCQYNPALPTPCIVTPCQVSNKSACVNSIGCAWDDAAGCFPNPCTTTNLTLCQQMPQCWLQGGKCAINPCAQQYHNEQTCMSTVRCKWLTSSSPPTCGMSQCGGYMWSDGAQANCVMNSNCYWQPKSVNGYADTCATKTCDVNPDAASCTTMSQCVWRNGACKDSTFVQCPMIDVVFLVEATTTMGRAFGRHPNGFMGIVEAIRTWSKSAPLSPSIVQTGFRLAIVGYGSPQSALQPADGDLHGHNFTADIDAWAGINTILDNFVANQPQYATAASSLLGSATNVSMFDGLQAAKEIFKLNSNTSASREKLLFILGHSVINDGSELKESMNALETEYGVQIFANLMTRFSILTEAETMGGVFMAPLASDPTSTHFSYQTIDQLISSTLDTFCDPTTNVGQSLGITSNGIVPCNWLSKRTSCDIQGSCSFNQTLAPTCAQSNQCPNLGCAALPQSLATRFTCTQCKLVSGAFACDRGTKNPPTPGVCASASCMYLPQGTCNSSASCWWDANGGRCVRKMCTATTAQSCVSDLGCVWVDIPASGDTRGTGCVLSQCGLLRDQVDCLNFAANSLQPCQWNTTSNPPVCVEKRCQYLSQADCTMPPFNDLCTYSGKCTDKVCQHTNADLCNADASCYWDPFAVTAYFGQCNTRGIDCVLSAWSPWSPCSASCGSGAYQTKSRTVLVFPNGGAKCDPSLQQVQACNATTISGWKSDCTAYCASFTTTSSCVSDMSCQYQSSSCLPKLSAGCGSLSMASCQTSDMCTWVSNLQICMDMLEECQFSTQSTCTAVTSVPCTWRTGTNDNLVAAASGVAAQLVNPGELPIHPFANLMLNSNQAISAAMITIESGYVLGKDVLIMTYPDPNITAQWIPSAGILALSGQGSVTQYSNAIRSVTFQSLSLSPGSRNITWSLGKAVYSIFTQRHYSYTAMAGVSFADASRLCAASNFFGLTGYLATITDEHEGSIVATKLMSDGWIGADGTSASWSWSRGPEVGRTFWFGGNIAQGGYPALGFYANWNPLAGEPKILSNATSTAHAYVQPTGYWSSRYSDPAGTFTSNANGFVCEFGGGGSQGTATFDIGGATVIGIAGCIPQTPCIFHKDQSTCGVDPACLWSPDGICVPGCSTYSTANLCGQNPQCTWSTVTLPPLCIVDTCPGLFTNTSCFANSACSWNGTYCSAKTGCAIYSTADVCNQFVTCSFSNGTCGPASCGTINQQAKCNSNPLCAWSNVAGCTTACKYTTQFGCQADPACQWGAASPTSIPFYGNGQPVLPFTPSKTNAPTSESDYVDGITVIVTAGFQPGQDILSLNPNVRNAAFVTATFDAVNGALQLTVNSGRRISYTQAYAMIRDGVSFFSTSSVLIARSISYVLSASAVYNSGSFFKVIQANVANGTVAAQFCAQSTLFGLQGSLARIPDQKTNLALSSINAQGFFGGINKGSDAWYWVNNGMQFWKGSGELSSPFNGSYAQFPASEPSAGAMFTILNVGGIWGTVKSGNIKPFNVVCQYGSQMVQPNQVLRGTVTLAPQGCFASGCAALSSQQCAMSAACTIVVSGGTTACASETWCSGAQGMSDCALKAGCYWSYSDDVCKASLASVACLSQTTASGCALNVTGCSWNPNIVSAQGATGACVPMGCGVYPTQVSCGAAPLCRWFQSSATAAGQCISRQCGYMTSNDCLNDNLCSWVSNGTLEGSPLYLCRVNPCSGSDATSCTSANPSCSWSAATSSCSYQRCGPNVPSSLCMGDSACLTIAGTCMNPNCDAFITASSCNANPKCTFTYQPPSGVKVCKTAQCFARTTQSECVPAGSKQCVWLPQGVCTDANYLQANAPVTGCPPKQGAANPNAVYALVALVVLALLLIFWRLYLAFAQGLNFLSPARNTRKYSPHKQYAADLIDEANVVGDETNQVSHRPHLDEL